MIVVMFASRIAENALLKPDSTVALIVLGIIAVSSCSLGVEKSTPRPPEPVKGQYVDSGFDGKHKGGQV